MIQLIVRNRVEDFDIWKAIFDSNADAAREAGLFLKHLWRKIDDPNDVYFLFEVRERAEAEAFMNAPDAAETGRKSGVLDGEYHFVQSPEHF